MQTRYPQKYRFRVPTRLAIDIITVLLSRHGILRPQPRQLDSPTLDVDSGEKTAIPYGRRSVTGQNDANMGYYGRPYQRSGLRSHYG